MERHLVQSDSSTGHLPASGRDTARRALVAGIAASWREIGLAASVGIGLVLVHLGSEALEVVGLSILALASVLTAYGRPRLLGPLVLVLLPAGERVAVLGAQVSPLEAVVGGGAIGALIRLAVRAQRPRLHPAEWAFAAFVAFVALGVLGPVDTSDRLRELAFWAALGVVLHVVRTHIRTQRDLQLVLLGLAAATLVEAGWALYEYADGRSERFSLLEGAIVFPLPRGTLGHPNALAQFLAVGSLAVLALGLAQHGLLRRLGVAAAAASSVALLVTFSRASWIALAAGGCVYLVERRARRIVVAVGVLAAAGAAVLVLQAGAIGARISSLLRFDTAGLYDFRLELVRRAARVVGDHPLTGAGTFEEMGVYAGRPDVATHPHNLFLGLAVFFGIPAALAFAAFVVLVVRAAWAAARAGSDRRLPGVGLLAVAVALLVNGLFGYPFWHPALTALVVLVLGASLAVATFPDAAATRSKT